MRGSSALSLGNTLASAGALFLSYKLAFSHLGASVLGLWALIAGFLAIARLSDNGAASALLRQTALERTEQTVPRYGSHVWAGLSIATAPTAMLGLAVVAIAGAVLPGHVATTAITRAALPIALWGNLLFAVVNSLSGVVGGCLDGAGHLRLRLGLSIVCNVAIGCCSFLAVPRLGLLGFALSQTVPLGLLVVCYLLVLGRIPNGLTTTREAYTAAVRGCWSYISRSLFLGILRAGFEPATKMLIGHFADLGAVAAFDLANRVTVQLRQMIMSILQPFSLLAVRRRQELDLAMQRSLERWTYGALGLSIMICFAQIVTAPLLSRIVTGRFDRLITIWSAMLAVSTYINTSGATAFFAATSAGSLSRLLVIHATMFILNVGLGFILGVHFGGLGVVLAWSVTFALGGLALLMFYFSDNETPPERRQRLLAAVGAGSAALLIATFTVLALDSLYHSGWENLILISHSILH